jgi:hypothetical protein
MVLMLLARGRQVCVAAPLRVHRRLQMRLKDKVAVITGGLVAKAIGKYILEHKHGVGLLHSIVL